MSNTNAVIQDTNSTITAKLASIKASTDALEKKVVNVQELFGLEAPLKDFPTEMPVLVHRNNFNPVLDPDFVFVPSLLRRILLSYLDRDAIMLMGDKGTGKTSMQEQICARLGVMSISINCGPAVDEEYLLGCKTIDENGTVKAVDGLMSYAARHGIQVCLNEISSLRDSVGLAMNDFLEKGDVIHLKHHGFDPQMNPDDYGTTESSSLIVRHRMFRVWATDNTGGKAVRPGNMTGTTTMNAAVRSRFTYFYVNHMAPAVELRALKGFLGKSGLGSGLKDAQLQIMIDTCNFMRQAYRENLTMDTLSFRELKRWAVKWLRYGDINDSFVDAAFSAFEEPSRVVAMECFEHSVGTELVIPADFVQSTIDIDFLKKGAA